VLERLEKLESPDERPRALTAAWFAGTGGLAADDLARDAGLGLARSAELLAELQAAGDLAEIRAGSRRLIVHRERLAEIEGRLLAALDRLHADAPLITAHDRAEVQARLDWVGDDALVAGVVDRLVATKQLTVEPAPLKGGSPRVARAGFRPKLSANQRRLREKIIEAHRAAGFQPPEPASFAPQAGGNAAALGDIFAVCVSEGHLVQIAPELYLHAEADAELRRRVSDRLREAPAGLTVAEIRDLLGTSRKYAVPVCEYLDRAGVTRRNGDLRVAAV
jgi:selenocysteine-specific elongation factor